jgi:flagellar biosynthesis/type III secretory pathway protein FliH
MSAVPKDFPATVQGELPTPFSPLLDMSRPTPPAHPRPVRIQFPDPEKQAREREQRARDDRKQASAAFIARQQEEARVADLVGNAFAHGRMKGYVEGVNSGLWRGGIAGLLLGTALVGGMLKLGLLVGA